MQSDGDTGAIIAAANPLGDVDHLDLSAPRRTVRARRDCEIASGGLRCFCRLFEGPMTLLAEAKARGSHFDTWL